LVEGPPELHGVEPCRLRGGRPLEQRKLGEQDRAVHVEPERTIHPTSSSFHSTKVQFCQLKRNLGPLPFASQGHPILRPDRDSTAMSPTTTGQPPHAMTASRCYGASLRLSGAAANTDAPSRWPRLSSLNSRFNT